MEIESQFRAAYELGVGAKYSDAVAELDTKYVGALERARQQATQADRLEEAVALKAEIQRVKDKAPLPETDEGADAAVIKFRGTYREQLAKLTADRDKAAAPILEKFGAALETHRLELAKADKLEEAVGSFPANAFGLHDLGGNARDWCQEWSDPAIADKRVLRGGSWSDRAGSVLRSSRRDYDAPANRHVSYGFRCVLEVESGG